MTTYRHRRRQPTKSPLLEEFDLTLLGLAFLAWAPFMQWALGLIAVTWALLFLGGFLFCVPLSWMKEFGCDVRDRFVDSFVEFLPEQTLPERRRVELLDEDEEDEDEE